jgi:hypothetical protein
MFISLRGTRWKGREGNCTYYKFALSRAQLCPPLPPVADGGEKGKGQAPLSLRDIGEVFLGGLESQSARENHAGMPKSCGPPRFPLEKAGTWGKGSNRRSHIILFSHSGWEGGGPACPPPLYLQSGRGEEGREKGKGRATLSWRNIGEVFAII